MANDKSIYMECCRLYGKAVTERLMPRLAQAANDSLPVKLAHPGGRLVIDSTKIVGGRR